VCSRAERQGMTAAETHDQAQDPSDDLSDDVAVDAADNAGEPGAARHRSDDADPVASAWSEDSGDSETGSYDFL